MSKSYQKYDTNFFFYKTYLDTTVFYKTLHK